MSGAVGQKKASGAILPRVLGRVGPSRRGPTLVVVSGLHGNEPAGIEASRRVLASLAERRDRMRGHVLFLVGNRQALAEGVRYVDRDLNRSWTRGQIAALRTGVEGVAATGGDGIPLAGGAEDQEQRELLDELDRILEDRHGPVYALDLHTTSGPAGIFTTVGDTLENRALALTLPVPLVLGLEEQVEGTLHDYLASRGAISLAFESGQHREAEATDRAEAGIWILLAATGLLREADLPELAPARRRLARDGRRRAPRSVELLYRHPITPADGFAMRPGYRSFSPIRRGQEIADDARGPVAAPRSGLLLMPLYQRQGEDGFFIVREFRPFWLHASRFLRTVGADRQVHRLPGIRRDPDRPRILVVNRRIARWYALQLLHLLGFRRYREEGDHLVVLRRSRPLGSEEM